MPVGNDDFTGGTDYITLSRIFPTINASQTTGATGTLTIYTVPANTVFYLVWAKLTSAITGAGAAGFGNVRGNLTVAGTQILRASVSGRNVGAQDVSFAGDHEYLTPLLPIKYAAGTVFSLEAVVSNAVAMPGEAQATIIGWEEPT